MTTPSDDDPSGATEAGSVAALGAQDSLAALGAPDSLAALGDRSLLGRVLDALFVFVGILRPDGVVLAANQAPLKAANLTLPDVVGKAFWDCDWWTYDAGVQERLRRAVADAGTGEPSRYDVEACMAGGTLMPIDFMLAPVREADGRIGHLVASAVDITRRRDMEDRLRESEERSIRQLAELEAIYRTAPIGLCVLDPELRFVRINERLAESNGVPAEAHLGRCLGEVVPGVAGQAGPLLRQVLETGKAVHDVEIEGQTAADPGRLRTWRESWIPLIDASTGRVLGVNAVAEEITEWKRFEQRLRDSEAEARGLAEQRELLLQELSHRVKNSLALVASMLALQRRQVSGEAEAALADAHRRILTIAAVYQSLWGSGASGRVDVTPFARALVAQAAELRPEVATRFEAAEDRLSQLPSDRAVSFGLLLNELLVNALKHAFTAEGAGTVLVRLAPDGPEALVLTVADDGAGLPEGWTLERSAGLGGRLIRGLADQLDAAVEISSTPGGGSRFQVRVPVPATPRHPTA